MEEVLDPPAKALKIARHQPPGERGAHQARLVGGQGLGKSLRVQRAFVFERGARAGQARIAGFEAGALQRFTQCPPGGRSSARKRFDGFARRALAHGAFGRGAFELGRARAERPRRSGRAW